MPSPTHMFAYKYGRTSRAYASPGRCSPSQSSLSSSAARAYSRTQGCLAAVDQAAAAAQTATAARCTLTWRRRAAPPCKPPLSSSASGPRRCSSRRPPSPVRPATAAAAAPAASATLATARMQTVDAPVVVVPCVIGCVNKETGAGRLVSIVAWFALGVLVLM